MVAMEACASAHYWGREISFLGHHVRLIAPAYVKPFVKRQKNDTADAEAISEAAQRPTMRFVPVKSEDKQASAMVFKVRDLLVRQRTQTINAFWGHLAEFGIIAPQGPAHIGRLAVHVDDSVEQALPDPVRALCQLLLEEIKGLTERIAALTTEIRERARRDEAAHRLMTILGIGPICATALEALAPAADTFRNGRDFASWMGLVPRQHSTGGKPRLGRTSKMGQRDLRRLLIIGASAVVRWAARRGTSASSWLGNACAQTTHAGDRRSGQQDGTHCLGADGACRAWALMAHAGLGR
jgi:transposase